MARLIERPVAPIKEQDVSVMDAKTDTRIEVKTAFDFIPELRPTTIPASSRKDATG